MSWLYDRRDQLNGYRRYAEIAHFFRRDVLPADQDDIEQDIIIKLKTEVDKKDQVTDGFLWAVARCVVTNYWRKKYRERKRFCRLTEGDKGLMLANGEILGSPAPDLDARLDAIAVLKTLPGRVIRAGIVRAEGGKLNNADKLYLTRRRHKKFKFSHADAEKIQRMKHLYVNDRLNCTEVAKRVGMSRSTVQNHLKKAGVIRTRGAVPKVSAQG